MFDLSKRRGARHVCALGFAVFCSLLTATATAAETFWLLEVRGRFRSSDDALFRVDFPFSPEMIPAGQDGVFLRTVDPGDAAELTAVVLQVERQWRHAAFGLKLDAIDLDDRNPTSSAQEVDVDELWLRLGIEPEPAVLPQRAGGYVKLGKFPRFERQDDRHLESYGLSTTTFNRLEDVGIEAGVDLGRHLYLKASYTQGNPVFMRDPNALAGDNGTPAFTVPNPVPERNSGIVLPYDADVHDVDFEYPELAVGLGVRFADDSGRNGFEILAWRTERDLAESVRIDGSFYGGDLDLLRGPFNAFSFDLTSDRKEEEGASVWLYRGGFSLFAQVADQDLAGLERSALEAELAWRFESPPFWSAGNRQILPSWAPAVRYSRLDADFRAPSMTPTPSFAWDWEKWDYGLRLALVGLSDLTIEYAANTFTLASGTEVDLDELLATLRLRFGS